MAHTTNETKKLPQNPEDAGCDQQTIESCVLIVLATPETTHWTNFVW